MSQKSNADGEPKVLFLEDKLHEEFGAGSARVICPITDPFVRHHGALGSFVRLYLKDLTNIDSVLAYCKSLPEVEIELEHDLSKVKDHPLRSHGGLSEQAIPLIMHKRTSNAAKAVAAAKQWRNYDIFELVLNGSR
ncbi:hypothetical protein TMatcc_007328 [Talaromyces marneffei ATCC 18224]|uniref:uncharacterized protein n=1 Tax=Talaromyces marneffei TaxID=37727 RepID=UPI0012A85564|nr:uncharacterized protein EYB26_004300 [Talaromyces marneffei]KAE8553238.1 hypothetical protein EYB25_004620 [Talaromyces marneffei]QGA16633.1 hypothetical protein EYB26_004300 [Talaromyces marneffei]